MTKEDFEKLATLVFALKGPIDAKYCVEKAKAFSEQVWKYFSEATPATQSALQPPSNARKPIKTPRTFS